MDRDSPLTFDDVISKETSHYSRNVILHRHANARMIQNILLIWLDTNIDEKNNVEWRKTISQFRDIVHNIKTFTDGEECIKFINSMHDENTCVIISGSLGQRTVPRIHDLSHVDSIFIFCNNKSLHETWSKEWSKIKSVSTEISTIYETVKLTIQQYEQNSISINFLTTNGNILNKDFNEMNPSFIFTQILKEIISTIKFEEKHIKQFIAYCRKLFVNNQNELKNIDIFERKYHDTTPIWWYTYECFLYRMLNRGLRLMDIDIITKMGFFISDLQQKIEQLHKKEFDNCDTDNTFTVYHGQGVSKTVFEQMPKMKSGLLSFDSFLCAMKDRRIAFDFAHHAITNPDLIGMFFIITIDPYKSTTPFAVINNINNREGNDEIFFPLHTVFRIREIQSMGENNRLFQVDLTLTSDNDEDLSGIISFIKEEIYPDLKGWDRLGQVLIKMHQLVKAQQIYDFMLEQTTNERERGDIYQRLAKIKDNQLSYKESIKFYEKSIEIYQKTPPSNHLGLAASYNGIGSVYEKLGEYAKVIPFYENALTIGQNALPSEHPHLEKWRKNLQFLKKKLVDK